MFGPLLGKLPYSPGLRQNIFSIFLKCSYPTFTHPFPARSWDHWLSGFSSLLGQERLEGKNYVFVVPGLVQSQVCSRHWVDACCVTKEILQAWEIMDLCVQKTQRIDPQYLFQSPSNGLPVLRRLKSQSYTPRLPCNQFCECGLYSAKLTYCSDVLRRWKPYFPPELLVLASKVVDKLGSFPRVQLLVLEVLSTFAVWLVAPWYLDCSCEGYFWT